MSHIMAGRFTEITFRVEEELVAAIHSLLCCLLDTPG